MYSFKNVFKWIVYLQPGVDNNGTIGARTQRLAGASEEKVEQGSKLFFIKRWSISAYCL